MHAGRHKCICRQFKVLTTTDTVKSRSPLNKKMTLEKKQPAREAAGAQVRIPVCSLAPPNSSLHFHIIKNQEGVIKSSPHKGNSLFHDAQPPRFFTASPIEALNPEGLPTSPAFFPPQELSTVFCWKVFQLVNRLVSFGTPPEAPFNSF